jgi:hypothetical protein
MKTKLFNKMLGLALALPGLALAQDANVILDGFNSYYNTYNSSTKNITGIVIEVGADGNNSNNYISSDFQVSLYLLPCDVSGTVTGNTPLIIATYTVFGNSLHQMGTYTFSNQTVDLTQVSGLSDGTYRMGAWVNSDPNGTGIGDPPDSQNDNAGLLMSSGGTSSSSVINFSSASGISKYSINNSLSIFPVPATNEIALKSNLENISAIEIYDAAGIKVMQLNAVREAKVDVSSLSNGVYFVKMLAGDKVCTQKFIVNR